MLQEEIVGEGVLLLMLIHRQHAIEIAAAGNLLTAGVVGLAPEHCAERDHAHEEPGAGQEPPLLKALVAPAHKPVARGQDQERQYPDTKVVGIGLRQGLGVRGQPNEEPVESTKRD